MLDFRFCVSVLLVTIFIWVFHIFVTVGGIALISGGNFVDLLAKFAHCSILPGAWGFI